MLKQMEIEALRRVMTKGSVLVLDKPIKDNFSPKQAGDRFVLDFIDDIGQLHGSWVSGGSMAISYEEDYFHIEPPYTAAYMQQLNAQLENCAVDSKGAITKRVMGYIAGTPVMQIRMDLANSEVYAKVLESGEDPKKSDAFLSYLLEHMTNGKRLRSAYYIFGSGTSSSKIVEWVSSRTTAGIPDVSRLSTLRKK